METTMKRIMIILATFFVLLPAWAAADQWVSGYTRSDGTYVQGYNRSSPNNTVQDNFSYYGNTNPYTGSTGTNKYYDNPTSEYYRDGSQDYGTRGYGGTLYGR
jgi:hypothetical protein